MRAATIVDGRVEVAEHPDPTPGPGQLLVRVRAAGINNADLVQRLGFYPAPPDSPPDIPGMELAGEVVGVGPGVTRFTYGDAVMALVGGGAQAELAVVHERVAIPMPPTFDWPAAGGFPEIFATAHDALFAQCGLGVGDHLLVHGAAGGVGTAGVQLGVAAGARVVATVRNESLRPLVAELGAEVVAPEAPWDNGEPFDVVLELVGADNLARNVSALAPGGRISVIGVGAGASAPIDLFALMGKRATVRGSTLRSRPLEEKALVVREVERRVLPLVDAGRIRVPVAATFALDEVGAAYDRFAAGGKFGKIVVVT